MRSRLWNVLVIAAIGWAALIGGQLIAVGTKGGDALMVWCLVGLPPLAILWIVRYVIGHR